MSIEINPFYLEKNGKIMIVRVDGDLIRKYDAATKET